MIDPNKDKKTPFIVNKNGIISISNGINMKFNITKGETIIQMKENNNIDNLNNLKA